MEQPKVSVIIPVYGVEKYIEQCARSLFEQTMQEGIEFIFIDDCSPDRSIGILKEVLKEYPHREPQVKIIRHSENQGSGGTRRTGVENATGEYVIHCDSDDWVEPDMYETLYRKAAKEDADIVGCDYISECRKKRVILRQPCPSDNMQYISDLLSGRLHCGMCNKLIKKSIYYTSHEHRCGIFPIGINMWEDVLTVNHLIYYCRRISYVPKALYHYRQTNADSYTHSVSLSSILDKIKVIKILSDFLAKNNVNISLDRLKIEVKVSYMLHCPDIHRDVWPYMYPEISDSRLLHHCGIRWNYRIALLLAKHHMMWVLKIYRRLRAI